MLGDLPTNLIISLNRFEYDTQRSRRIKIDTPVCSRCLLDTKGARDLVPQGCTFIYVTLFLLGQITLANSMQMKIQEGHEVKDYDLYAVVIHTGESANYGHYYAYARDSMDAGTAKETIPWLLYNDTSVTTSSFDAMQQTLARNRTDTPYMLFFRQTDINGYTVNTTLRSNRSTSNL